MNQIKPVRRSRRKAKAPMGPMILSLEPRIMFDGAAIADVAAEVAGDSVDHVDAPAPAQTERREVAFVDASVPDYHTLLSGLPAGAEVVTLDAATDGLAQIAAWAADHSGYDAIHIFSHGNSGIIALGTTSLTAETMMARESDMAAIGAALSDSGDILVYGCNVAQGDAGAVFIGTLAALTGADIAASTDGTGAASAGGDWDLEARIGTIETTTISVDTYAGLLPTVTYSSTNTGFSTLNGSRVFIGDFDNDGDTDILYQYDVTSGHVGYAENQGNGTFVTIEDSDGILDQQMSNGHYTPFKNVSFGHIGTTNTQFLGDFDGDGDMDILEATSSTTPRFLRNDSGVYALQTVASWTTNVTATRARIGDFDGDGDVDILFQPGNVSGSVAYARNDGNWAFTITTTTDGVLAGTPFANITFTHVNGSPAFHQVVDIDGDGDADLLEIGTAVKLLRNNNGTFADAGTISGITVGNGSRFRVADFDSDGDADMIYQPTNVANSVAYAVNNGDGTFTATTATDGTLDGTPFAAITLQAVAASPEWTYLADFDNDGDVDVLQAGGTGASTVEAKIAFQSGSPPRIQSATPSNKGTDVGVNANIVLTLTENVTAGAGNIRIYKSDGTLFETITANDTSKVTVANNVVTIDPAGTFDTSTKYYLQFDKTSFTDADGAVFGYFDPTYNMIYSGKNPSFYTFTTAAPPGPPGTPDLQAASDSGVNTDNVTSTTAPTFDISGTINGATVTLFNDTNSNGTVDAGESLGTATGNGGTVSITSSALTAGTYNIKAIQTGTTASSALSVTIDTAAPAAPAITGISTDSGTAADGITNDTTLTISGTAEANSTVTVRRGGVTLGTATADGSGNWSYDYTGTTLTEGSYSFDAAAADSAGNSSGYSNAYAVVVNTSSPTDVGLSNTSVALAGGANAVVGALSSTDATGSDTFTYSLVTGTGDTDNASFNISGGNLRANDPGTLGAGTYSVRVRSTDAAGNTFEKVLSVTVTANAAPTVGTPGAVTVTDTAAADTFSPTTGTLSATDSDGTVASYGIASADSTSAGYASSASGSSVTYDISKAGTYGTLYVESATGKYIFVPNAAAVNARSTSTTETFTVTATDNGGGVGNATLTVNVTGANDTPTLSAPSGISFTDTSAADTFSNQTGTLSGADADTGASKTYGISGGTTGGSASIGGVTYDVSKAGSYGTLYVKSSDGAYVYVPDASAINGLSAGTSESFTVNVSDGSLSATQSLTVTLTATNDTPTVTTPTAVSYTDTAANDTFTNTTGTLSAADRDTGGSIASYGITGGTTGGTDNIGGTVYDVSKAGTYGTLYVKSSNGAYVFVANASAINALAADTSETFTVTATDNSAASGNATLTVTLTAANDAPSVATPTAVSYTDTAANDTFTNTTGTLSAADRDTGGSIASYGITGGTTGGTDNIGGTVYDVSKAGTYGTLYVKSSTGDYVFVANASAINALAANTSETFAVTATDNGAASGSATLTVNLTAANDTPTLTAPTAGAYTDTAANDTFTNTTGTLAGADRDTGASLSYGITGGTTGGTDNIGGTVYDISKAGTYGTLYVKSSDGSYVYVPNASAINGVSSGTPSDSFTVTVSDGSLSANQTFTVNLTAANDIPVVDLDAANGGSADYAVNFSAGGSAVTIARSDATLSDADSGATLASLTVTLNTRPDGASESLGLNSAAQTAATTAGLTIGTYNSTTGVLTISGSASASVYQTILRGLTYTNSTAAGSVTAGARTISVVANDGNADSTARTSTVSVVTAPLVDLNGGTAGMDVSVAFTENGTALDVAVAATVNDPDSDDVKAMTITIANAQTGDLIKLGSRTTGDVVNGITITYTSSSVITLSGQATGANYQALLRELTFVNARDDINTTARQITVSATDVNDNVGSTSTATVNVTAVNDAPALSGNLPLSAVNEDTAAPAGATISALANGIYSDPDNAAETINGLAIIGNTANSTTQGAWQYSTDGTNWYAVGTVGDGATALALSAATKLRFVPVADYNGTPPALSVRALDASYSAGWTSGTTRVSVDTTTTGAATTIAATARSVTTSITSVDDAPTVTLGSDSTAFTGTAVAIAPTLALADVDSSTLTQAVVTLQTNPDGASEALSSTYGTGAQTVNGETLTFTLSNSNHTMTITGTASKATYELALRSIKYDNSATTKTGTGRVARITVTDDTTVTSANADRTISFNRAPTASEGTLELPAGQVGSQFSYTLTAPALSDPDGDTLTYTADGLPPGLSISTTGTISGTPTAAGTYTVTITATDPSGLSVTKTVSITIAASPATNAPNDGSNEKTEQKGNEVTPIGSDPLRTVVSDAGTANKTNGGFGLNSGFGQSGTGGFTGPSIAVLTAPAPNAFQVVVAARSSGGGDALVINAPIRDAVIAEGTRITVTIPTDTFAHTRADATVTLTATRGDGAALPGWMNFNPRTGTFEGTPPPGFRGEVVVKVVARDNEGRQVVQTFKIVVGERGQGNAAPAERGQGERGQGEGQPQNQPQGQGQGQNQRSGDARPAGRPGLTEQLRDLSQEGRLARQMALFGAKRSGKAA